MTVSGRLVHRSERERFDDIATEIGEDPARFLDVPAMVTRSGWPSPLELAFDRIRGIDELDVVEAWIEVELSLDRGPRRPVIAALNRRRHELREIGDRSERLANARRRDPDPTPANVVFLDEDGDVRERGDSIKEKIEQRKQEYAAGQAVVDGVTDD